MKKQVVFILFSLLSLTVGGEVSGRNAGKKNAGIPDSRQMLSERNLSRAIGLVDKAMSCYFTGDEMVMSRYYNPYTKSRSEEKGSVWMYTSSIEAVNAILHALKVQKDNGNNTGYDKYYSRYENLLGLLYDNADYYLGTFTLTSYTQTKEWSVYGVNRGREKGTAPVAGIENVYDDQQWLVRELLESYRITGNEAYLQKAEYLTDYVLDGWDRTLDQNGKEHGGITWGPGYTTKHSCSNGPMISPLVWLSELYKGKNEEISYNYIDTDGSRKTAAMQKSDYYLNFAKDVYDYQQRSLMRPDGVYADMMGGCVPDCAVAYELIDGVKYRKHTALRDQAGPPISYNSGTMISGAADLYRATRNKRYKKDMRNLSDASFRYFAKPGATRPGYYTYKTGGFDNWFNGVLMRGYVDAYTDYNKVSANIESFQKNLDYGYDNYLFDGILPTDLLAGWNGDHNNNAVEGMFIFAFAAEYALLARYELERD
ncbi:MAG: glycoside hydrolase family 76 protein [Bacteroidales bacterium]